MLIQKLLGAAFVLLGVLSVIPTKDATAAVLFVPLGIYAMFTREKICYTYDEGQEDDNNA